MTGSYFSDGKVCHSQVLVEARGGVGGGQGACFALSRGTTGYAPRAGTLDGASVGWPRRQTRPHPLGTSRWGLCY